MSEQPSNNSKQDGNATRPESTDPSTTGRQRPTVGKFFPPLPKNHPLLQRGFVVGGYYGPPRSDSPKKPEPEK